jgi:Tfp pilus assembly protein PilF
VRPDRVLLTLLFLVPCACTATESPASEPGSRPPQRSSTALDASIARGRALLDSGQPAEAEAVFAAAAAADGDSLRTRMWVLRAWMDQGRSNDTLDALDELSRAGESGADLDYLYGMAFARRAEGYLADGVADSSVEMNFLDAREKLHAAVQADAERYHDAFLPLANAAWFEQELDTARWAADRAVELDPGAPQAWLVRGKIAFAQFLAVQGEEPESAAADALWSAATESFRNAVERSGSPAGEDARARLAEAATQLGHAMVWKQKGPEATDAYATAIAWDPQGFDYERAIEFLRAVPPSPDERPSGFRAALEVGRTRLETGLAPADPPGAATLLWWLGWARFTEADWSGAEEAFLRALEREPEYANSWFYIGLARQYRRDSEGALRAMHTGWDADAAEMVRTAAAAGGALRAFENLIGWCATQEPPRNLDAAFLAEMLAQAMPEEPRHWNNLGLFLRDEGERLEYDAYKKKIPEPDPALLDELYARSYRAYQRALELNPADPQLINDTALMLAYHLDGDLAEVEGRYRRALALVDATLASPDLSAEDRARFEQTRKDIGINLKYLLEPGSEPEEDDAEDEAADAPADGSAQDGAAPSTAAATVPKGG